MEIAPLFHKGLIIPKQSMLYGKRMSIAGANGLLMAMERILALARQTAVTQKRMTAPEASPPVRRRLFVKTVTQPMATRSATILNGSLIQNSIGSNVCNATHLRQRWIIPAVQPLAHRRLSAKSASQPMVTRWATILPAKHGKVILTSIGKNALDVMP